MIRAPAMAIAALLLAAALAGCTGYGPPSNVEFHQLVLGYSRAYEAEGLLSPSADVRRWTIVTLARRGDPAAANLFVLMLSPSREPVGVVRATAAVGIRLLGDKRAIPALLSACGDPEPVVRADAVRTLGDLGGPPEIPPLAAIARRDPDPNVRLEAIDAVRRIGGETTPPLFIAALNDPDESVAFAAHSALLTLTGRQIGPDQTEWQNWWQQSHPAAPAKP